MHWLTYYCISANRKPKVILRGDAEQYFQERRTSVEKSEEEENGGHM